MEHCLSISTILLSTNTSVIVNLCCTVIFITLQCTCNRATQLRVNNKTYFVNRFVDNCVDRIIPFLMFPFCATSYNVSVILTCLIQKTDNRSCGHEDYNRYLSNTTVTVKQVGHLCSSNQLHYGTLVHLQLNFICICVCLRILSTHFYSAAKAVQVL